MVATSVRGDGAIRRLIAEAPAHPRRALPIVLSVMGWYKAVGGWKDVSARVAMLRMHGDGLIELHPASPPPPGRWRHFQTVSRATPVSPARALTPLGLQPVQTRQHSRLWTEYIHRYHYLGYTTARRPTALPLFSGAELRAARLWRRRLAGAPRDRYIGWRPEQRTTPAADRQQCPLSDPALGALAKSGLHDLRLGRPAASRALAAALRLPPRADRDFRRDTPL